MSSLLPTGHDWADAARSGDFPNLSRIRGRFRLRHLGTGELTGPLFEFASDAFDWAKINYGKTNLLSPREAA